jgi:hypothetical protein
MEDVSDLCRPVLSVAAAAVTGLVYLVSGITAKHCTLLTRPDPNQLCAPCHRAIAPSGKSAAHAPALQASHGQQRRRPWSPVPQYVPSA